MALGETVTVIEPALSTMNIDTWLLHGPWLAPLLYAGAAALVLAVPERPARFWRIARMATAAALPLGPLAALVHGLWPGVWGLPLPSALMLTLLGVLGWVVTRFSATYLQGEPNQAGYAARLLATLAAIAVVVLADALPLLMAGWVAVSLSLHGLLTFYPQRRAAQVAAHKKFLASRAAELALLGGVLLVGGASGQWTVSGLSAWLATHPAPWAVQAGAVLLVLGVLLKSAQMPVHGWLLQVMEAPTPVSALLHAGVVNLGGFVLIGLAPLLAQSPAAQGLLIAVGGGTALLASFTLLTRVSIKVRLAWSTCAQMGFMLLEIGLGLYELALMHLIGHSIYKAHAFLAAGDTARQTTAAVLNAGAPAGRAGSAWAPWLAAGGSAALVAASLHTLGATGAVPDLPAGWTLVLGLAWAPLLAFDARRCPLCLLRAAAAVVGLTLLYLLLHGAFGLAANAAPAPWAGWALAAAMGLAYAAQAVLAQRPSDAAWQFAYAGLYLDEWFTRLTFRLWPAPQPRPAARPQGIAPFESAWTPASPTHTPGADA